MSTRKEGTNSPALHHFEGLGYELHFQDGPIQQFGRNGTTNEKVIELLVERLTSFQTMEGGKFACKENAVAITHLETALAWLLLRTHRREERGVEGVLVP